MRSIGLLILLAGCTSHAIFEVPPPPPGAGTLLLLAVDDPAAPSAVRGRVMATPLDRFEQEGGDVDLDLALYLPGTPAELGWSLGPVAHDPEGGTRLVLPSSIHRRAGSSWSPAPDALDAPALRRFRMPSLPGAPCGLESACFAGEPSERRGLFCSPGCAEPVIAAPAPPAPPRLTAGCPARFVAAGAGCDATIAECGAAERALPDGSCAPLSACALVDVVWPDTTGATEPLVWVRAGVADGAGDGTRDHPWSLDTASRLGAPGARVVLSAGRHTASAWPERPTTWLGACAGASEVELPAGPIRSTIEARDAALHAGTLSLDAGAALTLVRSALETREPAAVAAGARLTLEASRWRGQGARVDGALALIDADLRGPTFELLPFSTARVERTLMVAEGPAWTAHQAARLELHGSALGIHGAAAAIRAIDGVVVVERSRIQGGDGAVNAGRGAEITLNEAWLGPHRKAAVESTGARVTATDVTVTGASGFYAGAGDELRIERLQVSSAQRAVFAEGCALLHARDVRTSTVEFAIHAMCTDVVIERLESRRTAYALFLQFPASQTHRGQALVRDVTVLQPDDIAILAGHGGTTMPTASAVVSMSRVRVEGALGTALHIEQDIALELEDAVVDGARATMQLRFEFCRNSPRVCRGNAIVMRGGSLHLQRFRFDGLDYSGLDLDAMADLWGKSGRVQATRFGITYLAEGDWQDRFAGVAWQASDAVDDRTR